MKELLTFKEYRKQTSRYALPKPFLILTTNYRKVLKILIKSLKDISKWAQFYKAAAAQPTYLLKKGTLSEGTFNNYAKVLITPILYTETTLEAYLESSRRSTMDYFCKNNQRLKAFNNFRKNASSQMFDRVLNTPLSSKKVRSSCPEVLCKKGVLRNFVKFTGKYLCQGLIFNKVAGIRSATFPVNFVKFLRAPFFIEHFWWLLLKTSTGIWIHDKFVIFNAIIYI